jgi:hypothetical protein
MMSSIWARARASSIMASARAKPPIDMMRVTLHGIAVTGSSSSHATLVEGARTAEEGRSGAFGIGSGSIGGTLAVQADHPDVGAETVAVEGCVVGTPHRLVYLLRGADRRHR